MYLFELDTEEPLVAKIIAVSDQLATDVKLGKITPDWTVEDLLRYYSKYDVVLSRNDLYNMIKQPPLMNYITNIQGDNVIFKGQKEKPVNTEPPPAPEDQQKIVKKMAKKASKK